MPDPVHRRFYPRCLDAGCKGGAGTGDGSWCGYLPAVAAGGGRGDLVWLIAGYVDRRAREGCSLPGAGGTFFSPPVIGSPVGRVPMRDVNVLGYALYAAGQDLKSKPAWRFPASSLGSFCLVH